jgi:hypothetical protein
MVTDAQRPLVENSFVAVAGIAITAIIVPMLEGAAVHAALWPSASPNFTATARMMDCSGAGDARS